MNRLRVNVQFFFLCVGTFIEGLYIIFIVKLYQISFNLTDMGLNLTNWHCTLGKVGMMLCGETHI